MKLSTPSLFALAAACSSLAVACANDGARPHDAADAAARDAAPGAQDATVAPRDAAPLRRDATVVTSEDAGTEDAASDGGTDRGDATAAPPDASGPDASPADAAEIGDASVPVERVPGWSVRKQSVTPDGIRVVLEEVLTSFTQADVGATRIQLLGPSGAVQQGFDAPAGSFLSDFCAHPSGQVSAVLIAPDRTVSLIRLDRSLSLLATHTIHDPAVHDDLEGVDGGPTDLFANGFAPDAARIASAGEDVVAVVYSSFYSVIAYRASFAGNAWSAPARTLVEPPRPVTPFLPIGGTFDTFGAIVDWFRPQLDTDEQGNAYVSIWAHPIKVRAHVAAFHDGLASLHPEVPHASDADILLTRLDRDGTRAWSRVVGTENEDEPYGIRARDGQVAVVGRSRRFPGTDNTAWDAFVSVSTSAGELVGSRAIALDASSIFLSADLSPGGTWFLGGSDGWSQNPDGLSVIAFGTKLLVGLSAFDAAPVRHVLPAGPRHNEVRSVFTDARRVWYGGHEDGPIMHTGDSDLSQIHATGVLGAIAE